MVLQRLGDRTILEYVLANARQVVSADDLYVVVGERQDEVRAQLESNATMSCSPSRWAPGTRCCNWPPCSRTIRATC